MRISYVLAPLLLSSSLSFFGAGCFQQQKPSQLPAPSRSQPTAEPPTPAVITFPGTEQPDPKINAELEQILQNFRSVKSFRVKFAHQTIKGSLTAQLDFQKPKRFRGTVKIQNLPATELVLVDQSFYLRPGGAKWVNLTGTEAARSLSDSLNTVLNGEKSLDAVLVEPTVLVRKDRDAKHACDRYNTTSKSANGSIAALDICAANGLPKYVQITTDQGPFFLEYYDYNVLFLIEKPM